MNFFSPERYQRYSYFKVVLARICNEEVDSVNLRSDCMFCVA